MSVATGTHQQDILLTCLLAIVTADHYSRAFERKREPDYNYQDEQQQFQQQLDAQKTSKQKAMQWLSDNRYSVVFGSWVASMGIALGLVGRNPYLTGQQKLVQARVYAQGLTIAVVIISLAFETNDSSKGKGRWETIKIIDPNDPQHKHVIEKKIHHEAFAGEDQWRDMVEAEENRLKEKEEHKKHPLHPEKKEKSAKQTNGNGNGEKKDQKSQSKDEKSEKSEQSKKSEKSGKSEKSNSK
jgi:hypothetical protein